VHAADTPQKLGCCLRLVLASEMGNPPPLRVKIQRLMRAKNEVKIRRGSIQTMAYCQANRCCRQALLVAVFRRDFGYCFRSVLLVETSRFLS